MRYLVRFNAQPSDFQYLFKVRHVNGCIIMIYCMALSSNLLHLERESNAITTKPGRFTYLQKSPSYDEARMC